MSDHMMETLWLIAGAGRGEVDDIAAMKSSAWAAEKITRLQAVVDAARPEMRRHERMYGKVCDCPMCAAIRALDGEVKP